MSRYSWDEDWQNPPQYGGYRATAPEPDPTSWPGAANQATATMQPSLDYTPSYTPQSRPYTPTANVAVAQTAQPQAPQNSWLGPAGLALDVVGTGLNAYGAYKQGKQADNQYNLEKEEFNFDKAISLEDRQRAEEERRRRAELEAANYAGSYQNNAIQGYGGYNAMTGR